MKWDGHTGTELIEVKEAEKSFRLNRDYLLSLHRDALRKGLDPLLVVKFPGLEVEVRPVRTS